MAQFRNEVKEKLEGKQKELTDCKKESRKRKKMIAVYQVRDIILLLIIDCLNVSLIQSQIQSCRA